MILQIFFTYFTGRFKKCYLGVYFHLFLCLLLAFLLSFLQVNFPQSLMCFEGFG